MSEFPIDTATLVMLRAACEINPDTGQTHLMDFLAMGERVKSRTLLNEGEVEQGEIPIYEVEHEEGYGVITAQEAIRALVDEILRMRGEG